MINWNILEKCVGFANMKKVLSKMNIVTANTVTVPQLGKNPQLDRGAAANLRKGNRNRKSKTKATGVGHTIHYDIGHGTGTSIGGVKYVLVLLDKSTKHLYEYGLRTVKEESILRAIKLFINELGVIPERMVADRDFKLISGKVADFLQTPRKAKFISAYTTT